jgi:hypothetical protein
MTHSRSADPFSTFLSTADRRVNVGDIVGNSAHPGQPAAATSWAERVLLTTLAARRDEHGIPVDELRRELRLGALQLALLLAMLDRRGWVLVHADGDEEKVELTTAGRAAARSPGWVDGVPD